MFHQSNVEIANELIKWWINKYWNEGRPQERHLQILEGGTAKSYLLKLEIKSNIN